MLFQKANTRTTTKNTHIQPTTRKEIEKSKTEQTSKMKIVNNINYTRLSCNTLFIDRKHNITKHETNKLFVKTLFGFRFCVSGALANALPLSCLQYLCLYYIAMCCNDTFLILFLRI